ncbi:D-alanyl-D-alanine carboxypeptidase, partial [Vibrio astriarenae]
EKELEAPINKGDVVGTLYYQINGEDIAEYPLMALETVDQGSLFSRMWDYIVLLFKSFF